MSLRDCEQVCNPKAISRDDISLNQMKVLYDFESVTALSFHQKVFNLKKCYFFKS